MGDIVTKKETNWLGEEKEVHYKDGVKIGESKVRKTVYGETVRDNYDASGKHMGETRREKSLLYGDRDVHYEDGKRVGFSVDTISITGAKIQEHYDSNEESVGKTTKYGKNMFHDSYKSTTGEHIQSRSKNSPDQSDSSHGYSGGYSCGGSDSLVSRPPLTSGKVIGIIIKIVIGFFILMIAETVAYIPVIIVVDILSVGDTGKMALVIIGWLLLIPGMAFVVYVAIKSSK